MKVGVHLPQWGDTATRSGVLDVATTAERCGLDSVWVADHVVFPLSADADYPYQRDGKTPFGPEDGYLEGLSMLAAVAGATNRVMLGTSVLVVPIRNPVALAKVLATIDVLAEGRLIVGVGTGWWREEFEALHQEFHTRGSRLEESLQIFRMLWRDGGGSFDGDHYRFKQIACLPRPRQAGGPLLLVGGMGAKAKHRAVRYGDGWHAVGGRVEYLAEGISEVRSIAKSMGRDPERLHFSTVTRIPGNPDEAERLTRLAEIGMDHVVMGVPSGGVKEICSTIENFCSDLLPHMRRETSHITTATDTSDR